MPAGSRLTAIAGDRYHDRWLERDVRVLDLQPDTLARARAFARAGHPSLAAVLHHSPDSGALWIEDLEGGQWDAIDDRSRRDLTDALDALHRAGGCHGSIDAEHVVEQDGRFLLAFPRVVQEARPDSDRQDLHELFAGRPVTGM
jgi:serine/threonine-protein kinase